MPFSYLVDPARWQEQNSEERTALELLGAISDVVYAVDLSGRVVFVSPVIETRFHLPKAHFGETYEEFFGVGIAEEPFEERYRWLEVPNEEGETLYFELLELRRKIGASYLFVGVARDTSERDRREMLQRRSHKIAALKRLAGGLAHELNDLLTVVGGEADMLIDGPCYESAKIILETAERAGDLTRRLMLFGGDASAPKKAVELSNLVRDGLRLFGRMLPDLIQVDLDLGAVGRVEAPPAELSTILLNLLSNAADAMSQGGTLRVTTIDLPSSSEFALEGPMGPVPCVALSVEDTGSGMNEQARLHMFDPFYSTKVRGEQNGMGLSVVHGIITRLGGMIHVYSEEEIGTRIDVVLPRHLDTRPSVVPATIHSKKRGQLILVVEDDPRVRSLTTRVLERSGFQVLSVGVPTEVLELDEAVLHRVALVVSDVVMPRLSGPELFDRLRQRRADLKAVFVTGYAGEFMNNDVIEGTSFLRKPWKREDLLATIEQCLDSSPRGP